MRVGRSRYISCTTPSGVNNLHVLYVFLYLSRRSLSLFPLSLPKYTSIKRSIRPRYTRAIYIIHSTSILFLHIRGSRVDAISPWEARKASSVRSPWKLAEPPYARPQWSLRPERLTRCPFASRIPWRRTDDNGLDKVFRTRLRGRKLCARLHGITPHLAG